MGDLRNQIEQVLESEYNVHEIRRQQLQADQSCLEQWVYGTSCPLSPMDAPEVGLPRATDSPEFCVYFTYFSCL